MKSTFTHKEQILSIYLLLLLLLLLLFSFFFVQGPSWCLGHFCWGLSVTHN